jgi:hypothetical protein
MPESNNPSKKRWTLLVYLAGDNNLTEEMVWSLQEMKKASSNEAIHNSLNLVALFDPPGENPRRYEIVVGDRHPSKEDDGNLAALTAKEFEYDEDAILQIVREQVAAECVAALNLDQGKSSELAKALENYPPVAADSAATVLDADRDAVALAKVARVLAPQLGARLRFVSREDTVSALVNRFLLEQVDRLPMTDHCAVVLSGHGSGAVGDFLTDNDPKSAVSIPMLRKILGGVESRLGEKGRKKIQILGMDSCQMSTIEVAYEVQESVEYLVASEGGVLNTGWPYHRVLRRSPHRQRVGRTNPSPSTSLTMSRITSRFYRLRGGGSVHGHRRLAPWVTSVFLMSSQRRPTGEHEAQSGREKLAYWIQTLATVMTTHSGHLATDGMGGSERRLFNAVTADPTRPTRERSAMRSWQLTGARSLTSVTDTQILRFLPAAFALLPNAAEPRQEARRPPESRRVVGGRTSSMHKRSGGSRECSNYVAVYGCRVSALPWLVDLLPVGGVRLSS